MDQDQKSQLQSARGTSGFVQESWIGSRDTRGRVVFWNCGIIGQSGYARVVAEVGRALTPESLGLALSFFNRWLLRRGKPEAANSTNHVPRALSFQLEDADVSTRWK